MIVLEVTQGSDEWLRARCGKVTASRVADVVAKTRTGWGAARANYAAELVAERLTGAPAERFTNAAMSWGTEKEPDARALYSFMSGVEVVQIGLALHPAIDMALASPDGLVLGDGLVEIKCPNTATHIETLLGAEIDGRYVKQMQWQMACTGRQWCDFASYDPRMPAEMQLHVRRVERDDALIKELEREVVSFLAEIAETEAKLRKLYQPIEVAA